MERGRERNSWRIPSSHWAMLLAVRRSQAMAAELAEVQAAEIQRRKQPPDGLAPRRRQGFRTVRRCAVRAGERRPGVGRCAACRCEWCAAGGLAYGRLGRLWPGPAWASPSSAWSYGPAPPSRLASSPQEGLVLRACVAPSESSSSSTSRSKSKPRLAAYASRPSMVGLLA